jgi:thiamine-phosphate pyrophosphorylase
VCLPSKDLARKPPSRALLYYITDRLQLPGTGEEQERRVLDKIAECAAAGVDYIQLREKDLSAGALEVLAGRAAAAIPAGSPTRLLISSRIDVALASGAHGVHLPADDLRASDARSILMRGGMTTALIGVSAHTTEEVLLAESHGADFAVFAPVFEKDGHANPGGLDQLRRACERPHRAVPPMPVLALGGVTLENAPLCLAAGAMGLSGIRLFQQSEVEPLVGRLRAAMAPQQEQNS